ncbi:putative phospholipid-binding protein MlaC precursor [Vibrio aerogenes CECT 7868]|uniref:Putative phospholipid-binding protein MlaC n=1 Tax=Vibrio aerogenes CECT 7868 TaxID=1216006 RepID=A0A1M5XHV3_9VIBR|nr:ABC transporter substrate-binding protein [Vibrio aerogenes]SHH99391.1 putative phospholipid-binding protein MlaC precursor [Vibrio aerogenes CECT 7868]
MWKRYILPLVILFISSATFAQNQTAFDMTHPYQMIKEVSGQTFARLKAEQKQIHQDPNHLKVIVENELMPYVNTKYAALKLLGSNLKGAKKSDVMTFIDAFHGYLVTSYAQVLTQYRDQKIQFGPEPQIGAKDKIARVYLDIVDSPNPNIKLEFKLRKFKSGDWQAYDLIAEGISLLSSKRSEWSGKIRSEGILSVANELKELSSQPIKFENKS